jgi:hypothetical protein
VIEGTQTKPELIVLNYTINHVAYLLLLNSSQLVNLDSPHKLNVNTEYSCIYEVEPKASGQVLCVYQDQIDIYKFDKLSGTTQIKSHTKVFHLNDKKLAKVAQFMMMTSSSNIKEEPLTENQNFRVIQYMEDRWLSWNQYDIDFLPFRKNPKIKEGNELTRCPTNLQSLKNYGGNKQDVTNLYRLPIVSSKACQQLLIGTAYR